MLQVTALYSSVDKTTRYRDFRKMIELKLIKFEQSLKKNSGIYTS